MLYTKYQSSMPCCFRQADFFMFPYITLCKTCDPRAGPIMAPGALLNKLGRGLLGNALYQISKL